MSLVSMDHALPFLQKSCNTDTGGRSGWPIIRFDLALSVPSSRTDPLLQCPSEETKLNIANGSRKSKIFYMDDIEALQSGSN
jgi:hypothetical protein